MAAITSEQGLLAMLKTYYAKEGLDNLLYRNSPLLKKIKKERIEGKQANFSALYTRGGAVGGNFTAVKNKSLQTAKAVEFQVTPGQLFAGFTFNQKELLASRTLRGAYTPIATAKVFAQAESQRKSLAAALYGSGYGELATVAATASDFVVGTDAEITLPSHAIMAIDIDTELVFKTNIYDTESGAVAGTVKKIEGTTVTIEPKTAGAVANKWACLAYSCDGANNPLLPIGLAGWIPTTLESGTFYGVDRSIARDRIAGQVVVAADNEKKYEVLERAMLGLRKAGSLCDLIVMNDEDFVALGKEIEDKTYFTRTNGGTAKQKAQFGSEGYGFSISTSFLDNVIDDPYCPKGKCYILSSDSIALWTLSNGDKIADGVTDNEPGKPDVSAEADGVTDSPYKMIVNDMFSVLPGQDSIDGPATLVSLNLYGTFVITSPSVNAVVVF